jgi:hypothetical protein
MKTPEQIINEIRNFISETRPFKFARSGEVILNSLTELENVLFPSKAIVEEPVVEVIEEIIIDTEQNVLVKNEEGIFEEITLVEETVVEEPTIEEPVVAKKSTKKK